jgi:hypothetical protein
MTVSPNLFCIQFMSTPPNGTRQLFASALKVVWSLPGGATTSTLPYTRSLARPSAVGRSISIISAAEEQWEAEFGQRPRQRQSQGSGSGNRSRQTPARRRPKQQFVDTAKPTTKAATKPADSRARDDFTPAAKPDHAQQEAGWKKRRSAAERKADGSYKPRQRKGPSL